MLPEKYYSTRDENKPEVEYMHETLQMESVYLITHGH